ncbi:hypothetical protein AC579_3809 [Pseudocercospora musae]|uniref:non-specific serine/threonine protein kinase n=1 Tax=Pseudocercospora musae TaxID=113226 RepID=A0A139I111_9PEZI|nr:hypothetical protein AC579_3809 [Pseudocercospora musae]
MLRCLARRLPRVSCYPSRCQLRLDQNDKFLLSSIVPRALHFPPQTIRRDMATSTTTSHSEPIEEETLPDYDAEHFYPVHIGDTLNARYSVLGKLGYGITSTVWLCRDLNDSSYVALKVYVRTSPEQANREETVNRHLSGLRTSHPGCFNIRQSLDDFYLHRANGFRHYCIVHEPLHTTMFQFQRLHGTARPLPEGLVKDSMQCLLQGLDFLHNEASVVHCGSLLRAIRVQRKSDSFTDIKLSNIMLQIMDTSVLTAFEEEEKTAPTTRKVIDTERTIYQSRKFKHPERHAFGLPVLCDFGEARVGRRFYYEEIQPEVYKAPEILLQMEWDHMVDIWNAACVAWDMIQVQNLFDGYDEEGHHNNRVHLGEMAGLLGHPPLEFLHHSVNSSRVFDNEGTWKANPPLSPDSLEDRLTQLTGDSKTQFLAFVRSMLQWQPEKRRTARQLLEDPWLTSA